ncbi:MAG TPA: DNA-formamidopyrimidine glycosylase family protein [Acidimicrobiales bacterium]|nr:DNA-formamidopyrimidine glycosylase family protein [Acidimicrobiales bacterium]
MPELPEVEALVRFLDGRSSGAVVARAELASFSVLKTFDPPLQALVGATIAGWRRRGKFLLMELSTGSGNASADPFWLALHLARGGWVRWSDSLPVKTARPGKGPLALRMGLDGGQGFDVTEAGTEKRLAAWVVRVPEDVEAIGRLGPDPLEPGFDATTLGSLLRAHGGQLKGAMTTQSVLAGVGNAYSDEALHLARLSPFKAADRLSDGEVERLYVALVGVLGDAVARSVGLPAAGLKDEKRSGMRVHGRTGEPCPECGDAVRQVAFASKSLQYCPTCQTGGKLLADRRLSRLLK